MLLRDRINDQQRLLHFAPESCLTNWIKSTAGSYISADIDGTKAMEQVDITNIPFNDNSFDVVWCSHVLEHVEQDKKAMKELYRITNVGGFSVIQIPIWGDTTHEDPAIDTPALREKFFYQKDHVRLYGRDVINRLQEAGFKVEVLNEQLLPPEIVYTHSLSFTMTNEVLICHKQ